jgi:hypothetical protein
MTGSPDADSSWVDTGCSAEDKEDSFVVVVGVLVETGVLAGCTGTGDTVSVAIGEGGEVSRLEAGGECGNEVVF